MYTRTDVFKFVIYMLYHNIIFTYMGTYKNKVNKIM